VIDGSMPVPGAVPPWSERQARDWGIVMVQNSNAKESVCCNYGVEAEYMNEVETVLSVARLLHDLIQSDSRASNQPVRIVEISALVHHQLSALSGTHAHTSSNPLIQVPHPTSPIPTRNTHSSPPTAFHQL